MKDFLRIQKLSKKKIIITYNSEEFKASYFFFFK